MNILPIPLKTKYYYKISDKGSIFLNNKKIKGWKHMEKRSGKFYHRVRLVMENGEYKQFYLQRLVYLTFMPQVDISELVIRHKSVNSLDNKLINLEHGSHYDNQVTDRKRDGNYYKRGKQTNKK